MENSIIYSLIKTIQYNELWKISIFVDFISTEYKSTNSVCKYQLAFSWIQPSRIASSSLHEEYEIELLQLLLIHPSDHHLIIATSSILVIIRSRPSQMSSLQSQPPSPNATSKHHTPSLQRSHPSVAKSPNHQPARVTSKYSKALQDINQKLAHHSPSLQV